MDKPTGGESGKQELHWANRLLATDSGQINKQARERRKNETAAVVW
jgi:hypothetical protein